MDESHLTERMVVAMMPHMKRRIEAMAEAHPTEWESPTHVVRVALAQLMARYEAGWRPGFGNDEILYRKTVIAHEISHDD